MGYWGENNDQRRLVPASEVVPGMAPRALFGLFRSWLSHRPHFTAKEKEHRDDKPVAQVSQLVSGRGWLGTRPSGSQDHSCQHFSGLLVASRLQGSPSDLLPSQFSGPCVIRLASVNNRTL